MNVLNTLVEVGLVPVFYHDDLETAKKVAQAVADGGARALEFTNRGDFAHRVFSELNAWCAKEIPDLILGAGSVLDPGTASFYIANGANFIVGPALHAEVARTCNRRKIPYLPGCGSVSEISQAEEYGVEICKIFPGAEVGGPAFVKSVLAPMPWARLMPTGGVEATRESVEQWFSAGVACIGLGSKLIADALIAAGDYRAISEKTAQLLHWIEQWRGRSVFAGIEHIGLSAAAGAKGRDLADWYGATFGFAVSEGSSSFFASSWGPGRIEIAKEPRGSGVHIAVQVTDFESACAVLREKGIDLEEPQIRGDVKAIYLKETDPAGNRVHLLWKGPRRGERRTHG
jgi:2-dehydro-3-deoxyphosphogluconate aldolase/(4S)-4-hydroxy-2-oxoglutarate aldolase